MHYPNSRCRVYSLILFLLLIPKFSYADLPIDWKGYAMGEQISNFFGGVARGTIFTEALRLTSVVHSEEVGLWAGGELAVGVLAIGQTHKQSLYTGAIQPPSGFSGVPEVIIGDLALQQRFNKYFMVRAGIMDFDDYFNLIEVAAPLMNSGLNNTASINHDTQLATYPYPGFGAFAKIGDQKLFVLAGVFQANPDHQSTVFRNGQLVIAELDYFLETPKVSYIFKGALWDCYQPFNDVAKLRGLYGILEAKWFWQRQLAGAISVGLNHKVNNTVNQSFAAGLIIEGFFKQLRPSDSLNLGMGRAWLQGAPHPETYYEMGYSIYLLRDLTLTPDLQFFTHPGGQYQNAWVWLLRLTYNLPNTRHVKLPA